MGFYFNPIHFALTCLASAKTFRQDPIICILNKAHTIICVDGLPMNVSSTAKSMFCFGAEAAPM